MAKIHVYSRSGIVNSVLGGQPVSALCGLSKVLTRQNVEDARRDKPICKECARLLADQGKREGAAIHPAEGWVRLLEAEIAARLVRPTVAVTHAQVWDFPLAG